jgi:uncharacterized delta-60 repeat protein
VGPILPLTDGSGDILVGGEFIAYDDISTPYIARLNSDGSIDAGFATGSGFDRTVSVIVAAADGSGDVYVGGSFSTYQGQAANHLIRLNSNGSVDAAFSIGSGPYGDVYAIVPATDGTGDIYVAGAFSTFQGSSSPHLIRLNSDGSIDAGFNVGTGFNNDVWAMVAAGDGSGDIYVGGSFTTYQGAARNRIARLNPDGSLETTFAIGTGFNGLVYSFALAADGSGDLYVGGNFRTYQGVSAVCLVRLNSNGSRDAGFSVGTGFYNPSPNGFNSASVGSILPLRNGSGYIYVSGAFVTYQGYAVGRLLRLAPDGSYDSFYSIGSGFSSPAGGLRFAEDGSGDIYVGGMFSAIQGVGANHIVRLNSDGSIDADFDVFGTGFDAAVHAVASAGDGSGDIYVGGEFSRYQGSLRFSILRLNPDGTMDPGFSTGMGFDGPVYAIVPVGDGSGDIYVGGYFTEYQGVARNRIVRLNPDGSVDAGFAAWDGFDAAVTAIVPAGDGSGDIYVGGYFTAYQGAACNRIVRLNSNGSIDAGFAVGSGFDSFVLAVCPAADGSGDVYVGGSFTTCQGTACGRISRLNSDGSLDADFAVGTGFDDYVFAITRSEDSPGDIYVGGRFGTCQGSACNGLVRLNSDGSIDAGFNVGSGFSYAPLVTRPTIETITAAPDGSGDIYVGGRFYSYNGGGSEGLIRLNSDGSEDAGFAVGTGLGDPLLATEIWAIVPVEGGSGKLYVGGEFTTYKTCVVDRVARLTSTGDLD